MYNTCVYSATSRLRFRGNVANESTQIHSQHLYCCISAFNFLSFVVTVMFPSVADTVGLCSSSSAGTSVLNNDSASLNFTVITIFYRAISCRARYCFTGSGHLSVRCRYTIVANQITRIASTLFDILVGHNCSFLNPLPLQKFHGKSLHAVVKFGVLDQNCCLSRIGYDIGQWLLWIANRESQVVCSVSSDFEWLKQELRFFRRISVITSIPFDRQQIGPGDAGRGNFLGGQPRPSRPNVPTILGDPT